MKTIPKLHLLTSTDDNKPSLNGVHIDGNHLVVTDGCILFIMDWIQHGLNIEGLDGCTVPSAAWKVFSSPQNKIARMYRDNDTVKIVTVGKNGATTTEFDLISHTFPNYLKVIPTAEPTE